MIQNTPITFTGADAAWVIALIISISTVINIILAWAKNIKSKVNEPNRVQDEKIAILSSRIDDVRRDIDKTNDRFDVVMQKYDNLIDHYYHTRERHDSEIESLSEGQVTMAKAIKEMTDHFLHEDNTQGMQKAVRELDEYIYRQVSVHTRYPEELTDDIKK